MYVCMCACVGFCVCSMQLQLHLWLLVLNNLAQCSRTLPSQPRLALPGLGGLGLPGQPLQMANQVVKEWNRTWIAMNGVTWQLANLEVTGSSVTETWTSTSYNWPYVKTWRTLWRGLDGAVWHLANITSSEIKVTELWFHTSPPPASRQ